jgi:hypothetical protein
MDQMEDPYKNNASNSGYQDLCDPACRLDANQTRKKSPDYTTDQTDDKITEQAVTGSADEDSCQPTSDDSADYPK